MEVQFHAFLSSVRDGGEAFGKQYSV